MSHADYCRVGCGAKPSQVELLRKHGSPAKFAAAVWAAVGEISIYEAEIAIRNYERDFFGARPSGDKP